MSCTVSCSHCLTQSLYFFVFQRGTRSSLHIRVCAAVFSLPFLKLDLEFLCAGRTAPYHSWRNPVERVMAVLNLGLQYVGLAREKMPEEYEKEVAKCNNLTQLRKIAERNDQFVGAVRDSLSPAKSLLCDIFSRLQLQESQFKPMNPLHLRKSVSFGLESWLLTKHWKRVEGMSRRTLMNTRTFLSSFSIATEQVTTHLMFSNVARTLASYVSLFVCPEVILMPSSIYHPQYLVMMDTTAPLQRSWEWRQVKSTGHL